MNISSLISSFATASSYTVTRYTQPNVVYGKAQAATTSTFTIVASVSPASGNDMLLLPEGQRARETRLLFTATALRMGGEGSTSLADTVSINSESWEVVQIQTFTDSATGNAVGYRCLVQAVR